MYYKFNTNTTTSPTLMKTKKTVFTSTYYQKILMIPCIICDIFNALLDPHFVLIQLLLLAVENSKFFFQRCYTVRSINRCA